MMKKVMMVVAILALMSGVAWSGEKGDILDNSRFTHHNDGTITDHGTDLMWVVEPAALGFPFDEKVIWATARDYCKTLEYAGYSDWRLPTIKELVSIVDYGARNPATYSDYIKLGNDNYWSVTLYADKGGYVWGVYFGNGFVSNEDLTQTFYTIPVRTKLAGD